MNITKESQEQLTKRSIVQTLLDILIELDEREKDDIKLAKAFRVLVKELKKTSK